MFDNFKNDSVSIMILDDQSTSRLILAKVVRDLGPGVKVTEFSEPREALAWTSQNIAHLIIVDYVMPEMNGLDFIKEVKKNSAYLSVPALMVTVQKDLATKHDALDAGVTRTRHVDVLRRPIFSVYCFFSDI